MWEWKWKGTRLQRGGDEKNSKMNIAIELLLKIQGREDSRIIDFRSG